MDTERIELEDALKHLHGCGERQRGATLESVAGSLHVRRERAAAILGRLLEADLAEHQSNAYVLTAQGRTYALELIRAHRLYETFLARRTETPEVEWHRAAHAAEHRLSREEVEALAQDLGHPRFDPHGDPIPKRDGEVPVSKASVLLDLPEGWEGRLAHVEDEPDAVYRRLVAEGFAAGMRLKLLARDAMGLRVNLEGRVVELKSAEAANLEAVSDPEATPLEGDRPVARLSAIPAGEAVEVDGLTPACRGAERRRLLDLGLVPGSSVRVEFAGPFGGPRAYRVRGSLIGLRREQAEQIVVRRKIPAAVAVGGKS